MKKGHFFRDDKEEVKEIEDEDKWFVNYFWKFFLWKNLYFFFNLKEEIFKINNIKTYLKIN